MHGFLIRHQTIMGHMNYNWNWGIFFQTPPEGCTLIWRHTGTGWTLRPRHSPVPHSASGSRRRHSHHPYPWLIRLGNHVELFRNIPQGDVSS